MSFSASDWILRKLSAYRGFGYVLPFGLMAVVSHGEWEHHSILWPLGFVVILPGVLIRLWGTKHIGRRMPWVRKGKHLITTGPYAIVRNPLYIGNIMIAIGLSLFSELVWFVPIVFIYLFILYHLVARYEEKKLSERWGNDYMEYMRVVPRWIPKFGGLGEAWTGGFKWKDTLRSEVPSFYVINFAVLIFVLKGFINHMK